jgi:hypothetical protein
MQIVFRHAFSKLDFKLLNTLDAKSSNLGLRKKTKPETWEENALVGSTHEFMHLKEVPQKTITTLGWVFRSLLHYA